MDLSEIETFLTIVNTKSITKTADILFLSQPTVSHRLKSLEKELGFPLIVRKKGLKTLSSPPTAASLYPSPSGTYPCGRKPRYWPRTETALFCPSDARTA